MRFFRRALSLLVVLGIVAAGAGWFLAGREAGPGVTITLPEAFIGQSGSLAFTVDTPGRKLSRLDAVIEQGGQVFPVVSLAGLTPAELQAEGDPSRLAVARPIGKTARPASR